MQPFHSHRGKVVPLDRANVDTDQIIPKQFLKRIERTGFGEFLFYDWRRGKDGQPDLSFALNQPRYLGTSILVAGKNFGCGSSREHAVWALEDFGFRSVISSSFADIFANNCLQNGMLAVVLDETEVNEIMRRAVEFPDYHLTIDLGQRSMRDELGFSTTFKIEETTRRRLLDGLDDIGLTLLQETEIAAYERLHPLPAASKRL
jgi:3-isopropylmalate/(R)-2-methylmalate dehydratase small subunit